MAPKSDAPPWPACNRRGCTGVAAYGVDHDTCLAHLTPEERAGVLDAAPAAPLDARGVAVDADLLSAILAGDRALARGARFDRARFAGIARFEEAVFSGDVSFEDAEFQDRAEFGRVTFKGRALFRQVSFHRSATFAESVFEGGAEFGGATFAGYGGFGGVRFARGVSFRGGRFARTAWFGGARFAGGSAPAAAGPEPSSAGGAEFQEVSFEGLAGFGRAVFEAAAGFAGAEFAGEAGFAGAAFEAGVDFAEARFGSGLTAAEARFAGDAEFHGASFGGGTTFNEATFVRDAGFADAAFMADARFDGVTFLRAPALGPMRVAGTLVLDSARFGAPVSVRAEATRVSGCAARFQAGASLSLGAAEISLEEARFERPAMMAAPPGNRRDGGAPGRLVSLRRAGVANLTVNELDLGACLFTGAEGLDQLSIQEMAQFASTPRRWMVRRPPPWRWTSRRTIAEEHRWRSRHEARSDGWCPERCQSHWLGQRDTPPPEDLTAGAVAALYAGLSRARARSGDGAGARDFRYGEMELRRRDPERSRAERVVLWPYWLLAGYGTRPGRLFGSLCCLLASLVLLRRLSVASAAAMTRLSAVTDPQRRSPQMLRRVVGRR